MKRLQEYAMAERHVGRMMMTRLKKEAGSHEEASSNLESEELLNYFEGGKKAHS